MDLPDPAREPGSFASITLVTPSHALLSAVLSFASIMLVTPSQALLSGTLPEREATKK